MSAKEQRAKITSTLNCSEKTFLNKDSLMRPLLGLKNPLTFQGRMRLVTRQNRVMLLLLQELGKVRVCIGDLQEEDALREWVSKSLREGQAERQWVKERPGKSSLTVRF